MYREGRLWPKQAKGTVEVNSDLKEIRGHAFIWKIEFFKNYQWEEIVRKYRKKKLTFNIIGNYKKTIRTILNNRKIWLTKRGLIIYEPLSFMGRSSFEVKGQAVYEMDKLIKSLLKELGLKISPYRFTTSREHYAIVRNALARQYNDKKEKMIIRDQQGTAWLWIDHSHGEEELETNEAVVNRQVQNHWNSHKKHGFKIDADFITENFKESANQIKKNADNLGYHAENMRSHVLAVRELGDGVKKQNILFENQTALFERMAKALEKFEK